MTACLADSENVGTEETSVGKDGKVQVKLHISTAGSSDNNARTRAWADANATDNEMMNVWTVVAVHAENDTHTPKEFEVGDIAFIHASLPDANSREIDDFALLKPGKYTIYTFANMEPGFVTMNILGIPDTEYYLTPVNADGSLGTRVAFPTGFFSFENQSPMSINNQNLDRHGVYSLTWGNTSGVKIRLHEIYVDDTSGNQGDNGVAGKTVRIDGNGFNPNASDNGFNSIGIPMSNVQEIDITGDTDVNLIVVRMMAKMELRLFNVTGNDIKVKSITMSGLTKNEDNNLYLLPGLANTANANTMEYSHQDIYPRVSTIYRESYTKTYTAGSELVVSKDYDTPTYAKETDKYATVSFFVNESLAPDNVDGLFLLTIELENDDYRYALVSNNTAYEWGYIARNDYRVIPIVLDDYRMEITPYDFPEIGGYPASVFVTNPTARISQQIYQMDFHDYGHFHLLPKVTHASGTQFIEFVADAPTTTPYTSTNWGLIDNIIWEESFKSYVDEKENAPYNLDYNSTTGHFYGKPGASGLPADNVYPTAMPVYLTDVDASENGDWPMLDVTSRWKPKATDPDDMPYIFGQIAPQEAGADKKVFHDFRVYLYVTGATTPRVLTYRFYMHLKQDHATARHRTVSCK